MTGETKNVILLNQVYTTYEGADLPVIQDVSLQIKPGEFVVIGGPNGAGKTTLLETIVGLLPVVNGSVQVCGHDVVRDGCAARKKIGYVIQNYDFHPFTPFTVEEIVLMGRYGKIGWLKRHSEYDLDKVTTAIDNLGLTLMRHNQIGKLSGGQQQKVLIAQNLAKEPEVLLLDEPFSNLDMITREEVSNLLCEIADAGIAVLIVSHAFDALPNRTIRVLVMQNGKIILNQQSDPSDVESLVRTASVAA
ncbi:MAG: ATP-binding cassette domain-containing protein [Methanomicrobiales archaeon]|nr:ATP-binding cassette domain-containing protein [Methanomicrobiales archaeon]